MGPLQLAVTWYKIRHAGEQAVHWDIQNKATSSSQICILYHVTASCKGPIACSKLIRQWAIRTRMLITLAARVKIKYKEKEINLITNKLDTHAYKI